MKYENLINQIVTNVGGESNVETVVHCATRLRFVLKDESKFNADELKNLTGVLTALPSGGQYHVVIGNHVSDVYNELVSMYPSIVSNDLAQKDQEEKVSDKKKNPLGVFIDTIVSIMLPMVNIMAAAGIIKGFVILFNSLGWLASDSGAYNLLYGVSNVFFYFLPLFVGYSAAKRFKLDETIGIAVGAIFFYPTLVSLLSNTENVKTLFTGTMIQSNVATDFFGIPVIFNDYSTTIIPTILSVYFTAKVYHAFKGKLPVLVESFGTPLLTLLISLPISVIVIGPIANVISSFLANSVMALYNINPTIISALLGGFWILLVSIGLHSAIVPIAITNFFINGYDVIFPMITAHGFAIAGAMFAIALKQKSQAQKSLAWSAGFSAWVPGVIEPALYGFILENKKLLATMCLISGIGGAAAGFFGVKLVQLAPGGIFAVPGFIEQGGSGLPVGLVVTVATIVLSTIAGFVLTLMMYKNEK
ncbi:PTS transporter subunit EIIC [Streptococcus orisratti]|uniref:PTS transporter subunit EIIC n=1 Tax=Streptococcus orisratti TaxID=114652 RepID=UPI0003643697|nr:PTS transporter subunit EIIC [Streptococcus orisratti]